MTGKDSGVSIVIRARNEERHLPRLFHSLANQSLAADEVILVDSGSTDNTVEIAREWGARIIEIKPADFTFGSALNTGCAAATGQYFVFVSAHVYPSSKMWLERLIEPLVSDERVGLSYGGQDGDHTSNFAERLLLESWFPNHSDWDQASPFCNNANSAIRKSLWHNLRFDGVLPGLEDIAWATEIQSLGHRIAYVGDARIVHLHRETFAGVRNRYGRESLALESILGSAELDRVTATKWFAQTVLLDLRAAHQDQRLLRSAGSLTKFRAAQFLGGSSKNAATAVLPGPVTRRMFDPSLRSPHGAKRVGRSET